MKTSIGLAVSLGLCAITACGSDSSPGGAAASPSGAAGDSVTSGGSDASGASANAGDASGGTASTSGGAESGGASSAAAGGVAGGGRTATGSGGAGASSGATGSSGAMSAGGAASAAGATGTAGTSEGCGQSGAATGVQMKELTVASKARTYVLSVPSSYAPSKPLPLVLAWHGLGGSGSLARNYFRIEARGGSPAIFVYPDGLPQGDDAQTGWDLAANGIDVAFFDALVAETTKQYCVDRNRIFNTGHSFGAMMTNALGCYRGDVLRAIAPVAGMPPRGGGRPGSAASCVGEVAVWIAHGDNDETVDYTTGGVATRDFWLARNACSTSDSTPAMPEQCVSYAGCAADLPVLWCVHHDGHNWPSFAGTAIWSFFSSFQ